MRNSLVEWEDTEKRYRLHDLARSFAHKQITTAEDEVQRRHAEHFLKVLHSADSLYEKGGEESLLGLSLFDREWSNISAGQAWAADSFRDSDEANEACSTYLFEGRSCRLLRQHPLRNNSMDNIAIEAARHSKDRRTEASSGNLADLYYRIFDNQNLAVILLQAVSRHIS